MPCFLQSVAVYVGEERKMVYIRGALKGALRYSISDAVSPGIDHNDNWKSALPTL